MQPKYAKADDHTITKLIEIDPKTHGVRVRYAVKASDDDGEPKYERTATFDFANVTPKEIKLLAVPTLRIKQQTRDRAMLKANEVTFMNRAEYETISVRELLDATRATADPATKARTAMAKLKELDPVTYAVIAAEMAKDIETPDEIDDEETS